MTGDEMTHIRKEVLGLTLIELAERWDIGKSTIQKEEKKDRVRGLYEDAIRFAANEKQQSQEYE